MCDGLSGFAPELRPVPHDAQEGLALGMPYLTVRKQNQGLLIVPDGFLGVSQVEARCTQPLTRLPLPLQVPWEAEGCISPSTAQPRSPAGSIAQLESAWMLQTPPGAACALTRVPEGLQGMQVALSSSPVVPELAAGVRQVPKALPLSSPVPQSTWNREHRVLCRAVAHAAKPRGGGSSASYRGARQLAGASAAPCQSCAGRCGQRPNSAAEQPPAADPGPAPHRTARGPAQSSRQPGRRCGAGSSRGRCRCRVSLG